MVFVFLLAASLPAHANEALSVDLSSHVVKISAGFAGTELLLFGAVEKPGDVVVVVRGPPQRVVVRKKEQIGGVWINVESFTFTDVPGYYGVASNRPLFDVASPVVLELHGIGVDQLRFDPGKAGDQGLRDLSGQSFEALSRIKQDQGLYGNEVGAVTFIGDRLFRSAISLPANVPTGTYDVKVFLLRDGAVAGIRTTPLLIEKAGIGAAIFTFAHRNSAAYALVAVALALMAGWLAEIAFRRA
jgi:uncharacterized protein (TIGR02186 family)